MIDRGTELKAQQWHAWILALALLPQAAAGDPAPDLPGQEPAAPSATVEPAAGPPQEPLAAVEPIVDAEQIEKAYGFAKDSGYEILVAVLKRADAESNNGTNPELAKRALDLATSYVRPDQRLRLQYDFGLQRGRIEDREPAVRTILELLHQGAPLDGELKARIAGKLCSELQKIEKRTPATTSYVGNSTQALLLMDDSRGLDIVLTDTTVISNLKIIDEWAEDDDATVFEALAKRYREDESKPGSLSRAALYQLMSQRRRVHSRIEPLEMIIDVASFKNLARSAE